MTVVIELVGGFILMHTCESIRRRFWMEKKNMISFNLARHVNLVDLVPMLQRGNAYSVALAARLSK